MTTADPQWDRKDGNGAAGVGGYGRVDHATSSTMRFLLLIIIVAILPSPALAGPLRDARAVDALCAFSAPVWPAGDRTAAELEPYRDACDRIAAAGGTCDSVSMHQIASVWAWTHRRSELLVDLYEVQLPPRSFSLLPWDEDSATMIVPTDVGLTVFGRFSLRSESGQPLRFSVDEHAAEQLSQLDGVDALSLQLVFELDTLRFPRMLVCNTLVDGTEELRVEPVAARLLESSTGRVLAEAELHAGQYARIRTGEPDLMDVDGVAVPRARIVSLYSECELNPLDDEAAWLTLALESVFSTCYLEALADNSGLQGAMTLGMALSPDGLMEFATMIDAVGSDPLQMCIAETLPQMDLPGGLIGENVRVRVNAVFEAGR